MCGEYPASEGFRVVAERSLVRREQLRSLALDRGDRLFALEPEPFVESLAATIGLADR
jgi:hypothetical protein